MIHTLADAGADFSFIDLEHFTMSFETAANLIEFSHASGITPMIRLPDLDYASVTRVLDAGCQALFVPHLRTPGEVERLLELSRYYPEGRRGMAMYGNASAAYTDVKDVPATVAWQNSQLLVGLNIETKEAVENLDDMLVPGVDFALVGYQDLSQTYGILGQHNHQLIIDAKNRVRTLCRERGIFYGVALGDINQFAGNLADGADFILYGGVIAYVRRAVREARIALDELVRPSA
jgi:2-dehydro-3-deoxyglucarate aldolase/4-hydroxy-2-oxoheptanedioate aldolase